MPNLKDKLQTLATQVEGDLYYDDLHRTLYSTDASVYKEMPLAVCCPRHGKDIEKLISFASVEALPLIPRAAGTSLAGQCVGSGIVVDTSRYMTAILDLDLENNTVWVEPGVIRDELNTYLAGYGLFFGPNTSTSNRCMIGGMVGNNSSGTTSIEYGTTRDHVLKLECILSDGSTVLFEDMSREEFYEKCTLDKLEGAIYRWFRDHLFDPGIREEIDIQFPKKSIHRRNHGYALDVMKDTNIFEEQCSTIFNLSKLLSGSEGTLAFTTKICLTLDSLPKRQVALLCAHFSSLSESMYATQIAMTKSPSLCELMDKIILDCTKSNHEYNRYRSFVVGEPETLLMIEFRSDREENAIAKAQELVHNLQQAELGYAYPILTGDEARNAFVLRTAGLGLLSNVPGDAKPVACIEDTAVALEDLPNYIADFEKLIQGFGQRAVYYAHAGAGELHLRPILDLKKREDRSQFRKITEATAHLVKSYQGTLSGEHGDGRVRAEFLPIGIGAQLYELCVSLKNTWDPLHIFNPGKIVNSAPMDQGLRYDEEEITEEYSTVLNFGEEGFMRMIERCNGSGDCRRLHTSGALMCPSYMATKEEKDSTRGRANVLREYLKNDAQQRFSQSEIAEAMDLCISCKGCTAECPSNVDMAMIKAEYLFQKQKESGQNLRSKIFSRFYDLNKPLATVPFLGNLIMRVTETLIKAMLGIAPQRSLPRFSPISAKKWMKRRTQPSGKRVFFFIDEFLDLHESDLIQDSIECLNHMGYQVVALDHPESGRAAISKGDLIFAKKMAEGNVDLFGQVLGDDDVLIGIEPSAILSFRDEYPKLVGHSRVGLSSDLAKKVLTIDEFLYHEMKKRRLAKWKSSRRHANTILLHGHCHQKALSNIGYTAEVLEYLCGSKVVVLPTSCCGMAGSFGYEKEHYDVSMQIGELVLFPAIRDLRDYDTVAATGTSCRHQIHDGTGIKACHPIRLIRRELGI